jgi:hypothetical protein
MQVDQTRPLTNSKGSRSRAIKSISQYYDKGGFVHDLAELIAVPIESQRPESKEVLYDYLTNSIAPK